MEASAKHKRKPSSSTPWLDFSNLNPDRVYAVLVILPSIILLGIFVYGFIGQTFYWSLTDWSGLEANAEKNYIGLENYEKLFSEFSGLRFRSELVNTFFFTFFFFTFFLGFNCSGYNNKLYTILQVQTGFDFFCRKEYDYKTKVKK